MKKKIKSILLANNNFDVIILIIFNDDKMIWTNKKFVSILGIENWILSHEMTDDECVKIQKIKYWIFFFFLPTFNFNLSWLIIDCNFFHISISILDFFLLFVWLRCSIELQLIGIDWIKLFDWLIDFFSLFGQTFHWINQYNV